MKDVTPFVRQCVHLWLAGNNPPAFTVWEVQRGIQDAHEVFADLDLSKAVSNELQRLERWHKLGSRKGEPGDGCGLGRPPRIFYPKIVFKKA